MMIFSRIIAMKNIVHRNVSNIFGYTKTNQSLPADIPHTSRAISRQYFIDFAARAFAIAIIFLGTFTPTTTAAQNAPVTLNGETMRIEINSKGQVSSFFNKLTMHEYIHSPGELWKIIYKEGERLERPVFANNQTFKTKKEKTENGHERLILLYETLQSDDRELDISLTITMTMEDDRLSIESSLTNKDAVEIIELHITAASGIHSLNNTPEKDYIVWPGNQGRKIIKPAFSTFISGHIMYRSREHLHTDLNLLYPGGGDGASMQWFDYCNEQEGLYVGSHNTTRQTECLHVENVTGKNVLRMGVVKYPFAKPNETWSSEPIVYAVHVGNWYAGANIYRTWIEKSGWKAPAQAEWIRNFNGWLRLKLKQDDGTINYTYKQIPQLFDNMKSTGINTVFLLDWEKGSTSAMYDDYSADERLGGKKELQKSIDYIHNKGGKVVFFLRYAHIDSDSGLYKNSGSVNTVKDYLGYEVKVHGNQLLICPSVPFWQEKMKESAKYVMSLGADGVQFDDGSYKPLFCFDEEHPHSKPNLGYTNKDKSYDELRECIKTLGNDKVIAMKLNTDIFDHYMDILQLGKAEKKEQKPFLEAYRYTFPEIKMINNSVELDKNNMVDNINHSFVYGLAFDVPMPDGKNTTFDTEGYYRNVSQVITLRNQYAKYLLHGTFIDTDGGSTENKNIIMKTYCAADGGIAAAVWNTSKTKQEFQIKTSKGKLIDASLDADSVAVYVLS